MKKRVITMILLSIICISACSKKTEKQAEPKAYVVEKPADQPAEEDMLESHETEVESPTRKPDPPEHIEYAPNEDWPDWFTEPTTPINEEVRQAIQGKEFDNLPKWLQAIAIRPHSVVAWLSTPGLIESKSDKMTIFFENNPEYIVPLLSRLGRAFEKFDNGEWDGDANNPPPEFVEMQEILKEIYGQLE